MPAACAADLREELLARVWGPTIRAASRQDAHLAEIDALEAAGDLTPPDEWEPCEPVRDPAYGPPDGLDAWLADLPAELLSEYIAATEDPPCPEAIVAGGFPGSLASAAGSPLAGSPMSCRRGRCWPVSPVTHGPPAWAASATMSSSGCCGPPGGSPRGRPRWSWRR